MFRLNVSHLQAPIQFHYQMLCPLWDPIVFTFVDYLLAKAFQKSFNYRGVIFRLCLSIKTTKHKNSFLYSVLIPPDIQSWGTVVVLRFGVGVFLLSLFDMDSCVRLQLRSFAVTAFPKSTKHLVTKSYRGLKMTNIQSKHVALLQNKQIVLTYVCVILNDFQAHHDAFIQNSSIIVKYWTHLFFKYYLMLFSVANITKHS